VIQNNVDKTSIRVSTNFNYFFISDLVTARLGAQHMICY
jgi:hypothetical protein